MNLLDLQVRKLGISLSCPQRERFLRYCERLLDANRSVNLTAVRTAEGVVDRHFLDSLALYPLLPESTLSGAARVVDVGAGAGFPGLPLKIVCEGWSLAMIESVGKKARFLEELVAILGLDRVTVLDRRAEALGWEPRWRDAADLCLARAVAALPILIEFCAPLVRTGGFLLFPKGDQIDAEIAQSKVAAERLHLTLVRVVDMRDIVRGIAGTTVIFRKEAGTPPGYPRRIGLARSRPLGGSGH